jgi:NAD(P)-dependent dehydrogenase (short-subunit alcohol dehydrogenase family)
MTIRQEAIRSGFNAKTTAAEALKGVDLSGKRALVTGGHAGLGLETTRALAQAGATVVVPARNPEHAQTALKGMPGVEVSSLDLMDPDSIDTFAKSFLDSGRPLDILVANAGTMAVPLTRDRRGYEAQFSTNHLGHFQLTVRLWPALKLAGHARVVSLSSGAHRLSPVDFDDPTYERREYDKWKAYGQSKSANVLFAVGLDKRGEAQGIRAFAVHPGMIVTDLQRHVSIEELKAAGFRDEHGQIPAAQASLYKTVEQGAATSVWCSASPDLAGKGGVYCEDVDVARAVPADYKENGGVSPWAIDPILADRLWVLSEELTSTTLEA